MEQPWQGGPNVYAYYADAGRPERQPGPSMEQHSPTTSSQRRYPTTSQGAFLPPPPLPASAPSGSMALPPFSQTFQSGPYHSPPTSATLPPSNQPHMQHQPMAYSPQMSMPPPGYGGGSNYYAVTSPVAMSSQALPIGPAPSGGHRAPPPHSYAESPRMVTSYHHPPPGGVRDLTSPTSPTTPFHPGGIPPSAGSSSSSSYPSISKMPGPLPKQKRRTASDTQSNDSWDEEKYELGMDKEDGDQPWGMPQEQYKALNPRDKKQVRNRIGARRFRAKRKEYVVTLESSLRQRDDEIAGLRAQVEGQRAEINDLRHRLGMPGLPTAPPPGLGLNITKEAWRDKEDRKVEPIN